MIQGYATAEQHTIRSGTALQQALTVASEGDTVYLSPGIHTGPIVIERALVLSGLPGAVVDGNYTSDVITIAAAGVTVENLTVRGSGSRLLKDHAGIKVKADSCVLAGNIIVDNLHGIYVMGADLVVIRGNRIEGRADRIPADRGNGIHLWNSSRNVLADNIIEQTRDGIYFSFARQTEVRNNRISNLRYGLHYMYSDSNTFIRNIFEHNTAGAALMYSRKIDFQSNVFAHNKGFQSYGVLYQSCEGSTARWNLVINNSRGVYFTNSLWNTFTENDIVENDIALMLDATSEGNVLYRNNFLDNLTQLLQDGGQTENVFHQDGMGNYWSDYAGFDLEQDGIGDRPHQLESVFEDLESEAPESRFYLYSPAAQLLVAAERAFPILHTTPVEDPYPAIVPIRIRGAGDVSLIPWDWVETAAPVGGTNLLGAVLSLAVAASPLVFIRRRRL